MFNRNLYLQSRAKKFKEMGICPNCTKNKAAPGKTCCEDCLIEKRINNFGKSKHNDPKIFKELLIKQKGKCAICKKPMKRICLDHSHKSYKIRGLLCNACNSGLGYFQDSPKLLMSAARYLKLKLYATKN